MGIHKIEGGRREGRGRRRKGRRLERGGAARVEEQRGIVA